MTDTWNKAANYAAVSSLALIAGAGIMIALQHTAAGHAVLSIGPSMALKIGGVSAAVILMALGRHARHSARQNSPAQTQEGAQR